MRIVFLCVAAVAAVALVACGDEGVTADTDQPPTVELPVLDCGPYSGDGNLGDYTGDVVLMVSVQVTDPNGDVRYVDATIDGAVFRLTADADGTGWTYEQGGATNRIARCMAGTTVEIRAVDMVGLVTTRVVTVE